MMTTSFDGMQFVLKLLQANTVIEQSIHWSTSCDLSKIGKSNGEAKVTKAIDHLYSIQSQASPMPCMM